MYSLGSLASLSCSAGLSMSLPSSRNSANLSSRMRLESSEASGEGRLDEMKMMGDAREDGRSINDEHGD